MIFINHTEVIEGETVVVEIKGALNSETSADFEEYINQLLQNKKIFIIIDGNYLEYISSDGIGVILYSQKKISANNGFLVICNLSDEIISLYRLLGFDKVFKIAKNKEEALQIMGKQLEVRDNSGTVESAKEAVQGTESKKSTSSKVELNTVDSDRFDVYIEEMDGMEFDNPIIIECAKCKCMIRVKKTGNYICPDCKTEFSVDKDQSVIF